MARPLAPAEVREALRDADATFGVSRRERRGQLRSLLYFSCRVGVFHAKAAWRGWLLSLLAAAVPSPEPTTAEADDRPACPVEPLDLLTPLAPNGPPAPDVSQHSRREPRAA